MILRQNFSPKQKERHAFHAARLNQGQGFKKFVECPKSAGEHADRLCPHQEMHLSDREIMEVEAKLRRDIFVWRLFMRKHDVEAD